MSNRLPPAVARITGAASKNPGRHAGRNDPRSRILAKPSGHLTPAQKKEWRRFQAELPWLVEADRALLDIASVIREHIARMGVPGVNQIQVYSAILSKLGATAVDRSRVSMPADDDEEDEFFPD